MAEQTLKFLASYTIPEFSTRNLKEGEKIHINRGKESGKLSFTCAGIKGAVSGDSIPENPMISSVQGDGEPFWLIHNTPSSNVEEIGTL